MGPVDPELASVRLRQDVEQRKYVRLRITAQNLAEHALGTADHIKPIMDDSDPHEHLPVLIFPTASEGPRGIVRFMRTGAIGK